MPVPEIDIDEFARRREQGAPVIDVRELDEYQAGARARRHPDPAGHRARPPGRRAGRAATCS